MYERFLDPRDPAFKDPSQWTEASTLGHTGRKYLSEDELYAMALDAEPDASAERRAELRLDASKRARRNVPFVDATFSVQKSVTVLHAAFEAQEVRAGNAAQAADLAAVDPEAAETWQRRQADAQQAAQSWAAHKQAVEDAIWAGNRAALDYLAEHAGYVAGRAPRRRRRPVRSTRTTGRWPRSSSTTPATTTRSCTSTTRSSTASRARTA